MKKTTVIRIAAIAVLIALSAVMLTGCAKKDEEVILGKWQAAIDFGKYAGEDMAAMQEEIGEFDLSGITMKLNLEFREDGTYTVAPDKDSAVKAVGEIAERIKPAFISMIKTMVAEMSGVDVSEVTDDQVNGLLALMQIGSVDEFVDQMKEDMDADEMVSTGTNTGKYCFKDGKLYFSDSEEDPADQGDAVKYELSAKELKLDADEGQDVPEGLEKLLPLVFVKVG